MGSHIAQKTSLSHLRNQHFKWRQHGFDFSGEDTGLGPTIDEELERTARDEQFRKNVEVHEIVMKMLEVDEKMKKIKEYLADPFW